MTTSPQPKSDARPYGSFCELAQMIASLSDDEIERLVAETCGEGERS